MTVLQTLVCWPLMGISCFVNRILILRVWEWLEIQVKVKRVSDNSDSLGRSNKAIGGYNKDVS